MSVVIKWSNQQKSAESCSCIATSVGDFYVYQQENTVTKTSWRMEASTMSVAENEQCRQIQQFIDNPTHALTVNLQKQGSEYRNKVWTEICKIPIGQVISYSELARKIDSGARAVANACRDNPFPCIIPCHRVVSVNGLGGYMGQTSGKLLEIKEKILEIESSLMNLID